MALVSLSGAAWAQTLQAGYDHFAALPGPGFTSMDFFYQQLSQVWQFNTSLVGFPTPGHTDTVVRRLADADLSGGSDTVPIEIVSLSLQSVQPVTIQGDLYHVYVSLDQLQSSVSPGTMTLNGDINGGTFTASFNLILFIDVVPVSNGPLGRGFISGMTMTGGGTWINNPETGGFDILYNQPFHYVGNDFHQDQFVNKDISFRYSGVSSVPEPFTVGLGVLATLAAGRRIRMRKR